MSKSLCKSCEYERLNNVIVSKDTWPPHFPLEIGDAANCNKASMWAGVIGISESSVRRHFAHSVYVIDWRGIEELDDEFFDSLDGSFIRGDGYRKSETTDGKKEIDWRGSEISLEDGRAYVRNSGDNPDDYDISVRSIAYGEGLWSNRISVTPKKSGASDLLTELSDIDLPTLYHNVKLPRTRSTFGVTTHSSLVVVWADVQVGKTGSRGGTEDLIKRVKSKLSKLEDYANSQHCEDAFFLSVGDEVESFENTPQQAFTNDLSFPQQLDLELTFELDYIKMLAEVYDDVTVSGVSSNHCRWRSGKNVLGKPSDDYGLYLKKQLEKALRLNSDFDHVSFSYPNDWDETHAVNVRGTRIGLAHGHQVSNPNSVESWWQKQAFGSQPIADADILITGHFHSFIQRYFGSKLWIQAPTLDNGSDWYRNLQGSDSEPGLLVFRVTDDGFDQGSLNIL